MILRLAVGAEALLLVTYWTLFLRSHVSTATAGRILQKSWFRIWQKLPKYLSIPYLVLIPIGLFLAVIFFFVESKTYTWTVGVMILILLPLLCYIALAPLKVRVDGLVLRRRLRRLRDLQVPSERNATFRSIPMLFWFAGFGLVFLALWHRSVEISDVRAPVFLAAGIFGIYWLVVSILMPDIKVVNGVLLVRQKRWGILPYYMRFSSADSQFVLDGPNIKVKQNSKDVESVRIDKMSDSDLIQVYALTRSRR